MQQTMHHSSETETAVCSLQEQLTALSQNHLNTASLPEQVACYMEQGLGEVIAQIERYLHCSGHIATFVYNSNLMRISSSVMVSTHDSKLPHCKNWEACYASDWRKRVQTCQMSSQAAGHSFTGHSIALIAICQAYSSHKPEQSAETTLTRVTSPEICFCIN